MRALVAVLAVAAAVLVNGDGVEVRTPEILSADVTDGTYYAGTIQVATRASDPAYGRDKDALYSLDDGATWTGAITEDLSSLQRVNATVLGAQFAPATSALAGGGFVVAWTSQITADTYDVLMRLYDAGGNAVTGERVVPTHAPGTHDQAAVAGLPDKSFVVVWSSLGQDGSGSGVFARRFDERGDALGPEFPVNTITAGDQKSPAVAALEGGDFEVVWQSKAAGASGAISARRFRGDGTPVDPQELNVDPSHGEDHSTPCVAALDGGGFVVGWTSVVADPGPPITKKTVVMLAQFGPTQVDGPMKAGDTSSGNQDFLSIAPTEGGGFAAVWSVTGGLLAEQGIWGQAYSGGEPPVPIASSVQLDGASSGPRLNPRIARLSPGTHALTWTQVDDTGRGHVMARRFGTDYGLLALGEAWRVDRSAANHQRSAVAALGGGQLAVTWQADGDPLDTFGSGVLLQEFSDLLLKSQPDAPGRDLHVIFRLKQKNGSQTWDSPEATFRYADPNEGSGGQVVYPSGYTTAASVDVGIVRPDITAGYRTDLRARIAPLAGGVCGTFGPWTVVAGGVSTIVSSVNVPLEDARCYQFEWLVTNFAGHTFEYTSDAVLRTDRQAPEVTATYQQAGAVAVVSVQVVEATSTASLRFVHNGGAPVPFSGSTVLVPLDDGANSIRIDAVDEAGNVGQAGLFASADLTPPRIDLYTIEEGGTYAPDVRVGYTLTRPLDGLRMTLDGADQPVGDLQGLAAGAHVLTLAGTADDGREASVTVHFAVALDAVAFTLLSPQARTYAEDRVTVTFDSSEPVTATSVALDGASRSGLVLDGLTDGPHVLELQAVLASGRTFSITRSFMVALSAPRLVVRSPAEGAVLPGRTVTVDLDANGPVTYQVGTATGTVVSGQSFDLPGDGAQLITFTTTLPDGASASRSVTVTADSLAPEVTVGSPAPRLYAFRGMPIAWTANKSLVDVAYALDGQPVTAVEDLPDGPHHFSLSGRDHTGRPVQAAVDFRVAHLDIRSPSQGQTIIDNEFPARVSLDYDSGGGFTALTATVDDGAPQLLPSASGTSVLQPGAGAHEVTVSGRFNESAITRRVAFTVGARNVLAGRSSIRYRYANCTDDLQCDVTVTLQVANPGDYDITSPFDVAFEARDAAGAVRRFTWTVDGILKGERRSATLSPFSARFEDRFRLEVDPQASLTGEDRRDNVQEVTFQPGKILAFASTLSPENTYVTTARADNLFSAATVGDVAFVEFQAGDYFFRDSTGEHGFLSPVDMGLLTPERNFVIARAYAADNTLLDSAKQYFKVLKPAPTVPVNPALSPWLAFAGAGNRIHTDEIDERTLARQELASLEAMALSPVAFYVEDAGHDAEGRPRLGYGALTSDAALLAARKPNQMVSGSAARMALVIGAMDPSGGTFTPASISASGLCTMTSWAPLVEAVDWREPVHRKLDELKQRLDRYIPLLESELGKKLDKAVAEQPKDLSFGLGWAAWAETGEDSLSTPGVFAVGHVWANLDLVAPKIHLQWDFTGEIERLDLHAGASDCSVAVNGTQLVLTSQLTWDLAYLRSVRIEATPEGGKANGVVGGIGLAGANLLIPLPLAWGGFFAWAHSSFYTVRFGGRFSVRIHGSGGVGGTEPALTLQEAELEVRSRFPRQTQRVANTEVYALALVEVLDLPIPAFAYASLDTDLTLQADARVAATLAGEVRITEDDLINGRSPPTGDHIKLDGQALASAFLKTTGFVIICPYFFCIPWPIDIDLPEKKLADLCLGITETGEKIELPRDACPAEVTQPLP